MQTSTQSGEVREALEHAMAREELRGLFQEAEEESGFWTGLARWWDKFVDLFRGEGERAGVLDMPNPIGALTLIQVLVFVLVAVLLVVVISRWRGKRSDSEVLEETLEERRLAMLVEHLRVGAQARERGELPLALRAYWAALVTGLGCGDELVFRAAWTCREVLARTPSEGPDAQLLARLLGGVERREFGDEPTTAADVDELAQLCRERLGL